MAPIRIVLGELPAILRGILEHTFAGQSDMTLVGTQTGDSPLAARVQAERPDVVIVGVNQPDWSSDFIQLFVNNAQLHILAIGDDARSATMQELVLRRHCVADLSPDTIVAAVRATRDTDSANAASVLGESH